MDKFDFLGNTEPAVFEEIYNRFKADPSSVEDGWRNFFDGFDFANRAYPVKKQESINNSDEFKVITLINDYRRRGHLFTKTNPVRTTSPAEVQRRYPSRRLPPIDSQYALRHRQ